MYILASQSTTGENELKAITVTPNGWSNQWSGVVNNQRVLQKFGCSVRDIPLTYGRPSLGYSILSNSLSDGLAYDGAHYEDNPKREILEGIDGVLTSGCAGFTWDVVAHAAYPFGSTHLLKKTIRSDPGNVDLLVLGPYSNVAALIQDDPTIIEDIRTIYISGGYGVHGSLATNMDVEEVARLQDASNVTRPDYDKTKTPSVWNGGQNIYLDANAASLVYSSVAMCQRDLALQGHGEPEGLKHPKRCPEMILMSGLAQHDLQMTTEQENEALCTPHCDSSTLQQNIKQLYDNIPTCLHETVDDFYYWDQSVALLAMGHDDFCEEWITRKITVSLVDGPFFGAVLDDTKYGAEIRACNKANRTKFLDTCKCPRFFYAAHTYWRRSNSLDDYRLGGISRLGRRCGCLWFSNIFSTNGVLRLSSQRKIDMVHNRWRSSVYDLAIPSM